MSQWRDAEACLSKLKAISPYSALSCHATGKVLALLLLVSHLWVELPKLSDILT